MFFVVKSLRFISDNLSHQNIEEREGKKGPTQDSPVAAWSFQNMKENEIDCTENSHHPIQDFLIPICLFILMFCGQTG